MPDTELSLARRAYDMAVANQALLQAHLTNCDERARQMVNTVNVRHDTLLERINQFGDRMQTIQNVVLAATGTIILGLFSVIGVLLHNGGHF